MTLKVKLVGAGILSTILTIAIFATVFAVNNQTSAKIKQNLEQVELVNGDIYPGLDACRRMKLNVVQVQQWCSDISATRALDGFNDGLELADEHVSLFNQDLQWMYNQHDDMKADLDKISVAFTPYFETGKRMANAYINDGPAGGNLVMEEFDTAASNINEAIDGLLTTLETEYDNAMKTIDENQRGISAQSSKQATVTFIGVLLLAFLIGGLCLLLKSIIQPVADMAEAAGVYATGDFRRRLDLNERSDEIGKLHGSFVAMRESIASLVEKTANAAEQVSAASQQLSSSASETSRSVEEVARAVSEVAAGSQETAHNVENASANLSQSRIAIDTVASEAQEAARLSEDANREAESGMLAARDAVKKIDGVTLTVNSAADVVQALGRKSEQIGNIVELISNIAGQTNLLALNAAIEAARAGEMGRGFAVVAEEVRKLAEESNQAALSISGLIGEIREEMDRALKAMEDGKIEVAEGQKIVSQTGDKLNLIVDAAQSALVKVNNISNASEEVLSGASELDTMMGSIASVSQQSAAGAEEASASTQQQTAAMQQVNSSSQTLAQMAGELSDLVSQFRV